MYLFPICLTTFLKTLAVKCDSLIAGMSWLMPATARRPWFGSLGALETVPCIAEATILRAVNGFPVFVVLVQIWPLAFNRFY